MEALGQSDGKRTPSRLSGIRMTIITGIDRSSNLDYPRVSSFLRFSWLVNRCCAKRHLVGGSRRLKLFKDICHMAFREALSTHLKVLASPPHHNSLLISFLLLCQHPRQFSWSRLANTACPSLALLCLHLRRVGSPDDVKALTTLRTYFHS
jgi:hypothetical protein